MIVKSPLRKNKAHPNIRKDSVRHKNRLPGNGFANESSNGTSHGRHINKDQKKKKILFPRLKPWKVILVVFIIGILGLLYLNHVLVTQELLREVQQLEHEYNRAKRMHADYRLTYDRMIGPAEIYEKAKELGFVNGGPAEKVIEVEKK